MTRMTQAALGVGYLAGVSPALHAAQWSFAPTVNVSVDDDSNRYLTEQAVVSQSGNVNPTADFQWSNDTSSLKLTPWLMWQQISNSTYANAHSESLNGEYDRTGELGQLTLTGGLSDYTTLATDIPNTGLVAPGISQRSRQGALTYSYIQTERRSLVVQLSWVDIGYYGPNSDLYNLLSGYKYASVSVGEKFDLTLKSSVTVSAFDNQLITPLSIGNSRESGLRGDFKHSFTERISLSGYAGVSQRSLENVRTDGADATQESLHATDTTAALGGFSFSYATERGHLDLSYSNSLQPYSQGVLGQRQTLTLSDTQSVTERLAVRISAGRIQNNHSLVELGIDRGYYDTLGLGLDWRIAQSWFLHSDLDATHTETLTFGTDQPTRALTEWHVAFALSWKPLPTTRTF